MKRLKKVLMAVVLVALLISSVVTIAIADASYSGTVAGAQKKLDAVYAATKESTSKTGLADAKAPALKELYEYLVTVDPQSDGYGAIKTAYNSMTFKVMHTYFEAYKSAVTDEGRAEALAKVHTYKKAAPVIGDADDVSFAYGFVCTNTNCDEYRDFEVHEFFNGLENEGLKCPGKCSETAQKLEYTKDAGKVEIYVEFEEQFNSAALANVETLVAYLFSLEEIGEQYDEKYDSYYDYLRACKEVDGLLADLKQMESKPSAESALYTGNVSDAASKLSSVTAASDFEKLKTALALTYNYLVKTPVDPTSDSFFPFISNYKALSESLVSQLKDKIEACETPDAQIAELARFREYLTLTPISEYVINEYNAVKVQIIDEIIKEYEDAEDIVGNLPDIYPEVFTPVYSDALDEFKNKLDAAEEALAAEEDITELVVELYSSCASAFAYNPDADGYKALVDRYVALCNGYVEDKFVAPLNSAKLVSDKLVALAEFNEFVAETPLCESVVNKYNQIRESLIAKLEAVSDMVADKNLPVYKAPAVVQSTASEAVLELFVDNLNSSADKYDAAEDVSKAAALEDIKKAVADLRAYVIGVNLNGSEEFYEEFVAAYNAARDRISVLLVSIIDSAESGKVIDALETVRAFLVEAPLSAAATAEYNAKVDALVADAGKASALKLTNVYDEIDTLISAINATDNVTELRNLGKQLFALDNNSNLDITDLAYRAYVINRDNAFKKIADAIYADIVASLNASAASEDAALVAGYLKYASDVYVEDVVAKTANALKYVRESFAASNEQLTETNENTGKIDTDYEAIASLVENFDSAESLLERKEAFVALFDAIWDTYFNTVFISGDSYSAIILEYERVLLDFESELIALLEADVSVYSLAENLRLVCDFANECFLSKNVIDVYNAVREEISSQNLGEIAEKANAECPELQYTTPAGWNPNLTRINLAIQGSIDENGVVENKFNAAYGILAGKFGYQGPQVIDFGVLGFYDTVKAFDTVKHDIIDQYVGNEEKGVIGKIDAADGKDAKIAALSELGKFVEKYSFLETFVSGYNNAFVKIRAAYNEILTGPADGFQALLREIRSRMESCEIDADYLSDFDKKVYEACQKLVTVAGYGELDKYINEYHTIDLSSSDSLALLFKNMTFDELNSCANSFNFGDVSDNIIAEVNLEFAFAVYMREFDAEIAGLSADAREKKIDALGDTIETKRIPSYLVDLYNAMYGKEVSALPIVNIEETDANKATVLDYANTLGKVAAADSAAATRIVLFELIEYTNAHWFSDEEYGSSRKDEIARIREAIASETQAQIEFLDGLVDPEEAKIEAETFYDFDVWDTSNRPNTFFADWGNPSSYEKKIEVVPGSSNKAIKFVNSGGNESQYSVSIVNATIGLVLDFDVMTLKDNLTFKMQFHGDNNNYTAIEFLDGVLQGADKYSEFPADKEIKAVPGEWMHITIVIDHVNQTQELYVDYVSIGKIAINAPKERFEDGAKLGNAFRICMFKTSIYFDNWKVYQGTAYRTLAAGPVVENNADKFKDYMSTLLDARANATDRLAAYYSAQGIRASVASELPDLVAQLDEFDITDVKEKAQAEHLKQVQALVNKALASANQSDIDAANSYIEKNRLYIDQTSAEFRSCAQALIAAADKIAWIDNVKKYVTVIDSFHRATSYASLTRHLENVAYYYKLCELDDAEKMADALKLSEVIAFNQKMAKDASALTLVSDISFANYYTKYVPAKLAAQLRYENSAKAVDCVAVIDALVENKDQLTLDAYKAALLAAIDIEKNKDNFDYANPYFNIVRNIITSGEYDESYEGFDHVLEVFDILNKTFSEFTQNVHYAHIEEQLEKYRNTESYIERAGICTYLRNYIRENDVDMSSQEGRGYVYSLEMFEEELVEYKTKYDAILAANTESFIGMVKKMQAYVTYAELKPLYDETVEKYYYNMNVDSEEARAAIEIFEQYEKKIKDWEENSAMLLVYVKDLKSTRIAQKFRALVRCSNYIDGADAAVSAEVAAAIKLYKNAYSEYMEMIEPTIYETADVANIVSALKTNRISVNILAMVNAIINK